MALTVAELDAKLKLDDQGFQQGLRGAEQGFDRLTVAGQKTAAVGKDLTKKLTLPLAGVAAGALKTAVDFDTSMSRIVGLVGVASDEVDEMRDGVLQLAGETTKSPQELADALFTVTSAGFRGSEAMDVLEMSAKASAAGLGETRAIAEALTATINTYGADVISAAEATDVLVATAQAGNFATEDLAGALGRVLPFAKAANVSFEDLGGGVALLTRQNNDANESITQMTALFRAFVRPSQQAQTVLGDLGLTAGDVREMLGEQGLVATLQYLDDALDGNRETLGRVIEDAGGFAAALRIIDASADEINDTFGVTNEATGMLSDAWEAFAGSAGYEGARALSQLQVALIQIGEVLIPLASDVLGFSADMLSAFAELPEPVLKVAVALGAIAAATGPVLWAAGNLMIAFGGLRKAMLLVSTASGKLGLARSAAAIGGLTAVIGVATVAWSAYRSTQDEARRANEEMRAALESTGGALDGQAAELIGVRLEAAGLVDDFNAAGIALTDVTAALDGSDAEWSAFVDNLRAAAVETGNMNLVSPATIEILGQLRAQVVENRDAMEEMGEFTGDAGDEIADLGELTPETRAEMEAMGLDADEVAAAMDNAADGTGGFGDALQVAQGEMEATQEALSEVVAALDDLLGSLFDVDGALRSQEAAFEAAREAAGEHGNSLDISTEQGRANQEMLEGLVQEHASVVAALAENASSEEEFQRGAAESRRATEAVMRSLGFTEGQIRDYIAALDDVDELVETDITAHVADAIAAMRRFEREAERATRDRTMTVSAEARIRITEQQMGGARTAGPQLRHGGGIVHGPRGHEVHALLLGQEEVLTEHDPRHWQNLGRMLADAGGSLRPPEVAKAPAPVQQPAPQQRASTLEIKVTGNGSRAREIQEDVRAGHIQLHVDGKPVRAGRR